MGAQDVLRAQYAPSAVHPRFVVIPNWERLDEFPDEPVDAWEGYRSLPVNGRTGYSPDEQSQLPGGARGQLGQGDGGRSLGSRESAKERAK